MSELIRFLIKSGAIIPCKFNHNSIFTFNVFNRFSSGDSKLQFISNLIKYKSPLSNVFVHPLASTVLSLLVFVPFLSIE